LCRQAAPAGATSDRRSGAGKEPLDASTRTSEIQLPRTTARPLEARGWVEHSPNQRAKNRAAPRLTKLTQETSSQSGTTREAGLPSTCRRRGVVVPVVLFAMPVLKEPRRLSQQSALEVRLPGMGSGRSTPLRPVRRGPHACHQRDASRASAASHPLVPPSAASAQP
jgi:hypothetical protein